MKIAFVALNASSASPVYRAKLAAQWVNKFTEHSAFLVTASELNCSEPFAIFRNCDVVVFHKHGEPISKLLRKIKKHYPHIKLVYDTDDYDPDVWDYYFVEHFFYDSFKQFAEAITECDGVTVASNPLGEKIREKYGVDTCTIENGFDLSLSQHAGRSVDYFTADQPQDNFVKVAYGGGTNHYRELSWLLKSGILQELIDNYRVDFYFYGILQSQRDFVIRGKIGSLFAKRGASMNWFMKNFYSDAQFLIAPLLNCSFNDCRSTIKLIEAGVMHKTIIASDVKVYKEYHNQDAVSIIQNDPKVWHDTILEHIKNPEICVQRGKENRATVEQYNDAQRLTNQRINYYQTLKVQR